MVSKGKEKHFFLGGNTPKGFFSYYDHLVSQEAARKIYCIKGGPGTGKSSLMKRIAAQMLKRGYDVEMMHCSSDCNSLDAILIKPANLAFVDGTAPHVVDPKTPGAVDEIINLGACWNESALRIYKEDIIRLNKSISEQFSRAYVYLGAAKKLLDDVDVIQTSCINQSVYSNFLESILFHEFAELPISEVPGKIRRMFAGAITPQGVVHYLDSILDGYKVYSIQGETGTLLNEVADIAVRRGFDAECYDCPFAPGEKCDHLLIPKLNLAFTTVNRYHRYQGGEQVDLREYINGYLPERYQEALEFDRKEAERLTDRAIAMIAQAKKLHDELEGFYVPNMDFSMVEEIYQHTLDEAITML